MYAMSGEAALGAPSEQHGGEQPVEQDADGDADGHGDRERMQAGERGRTVGQRQPTTGRLFALELVVVQLVWLALLGGAAWLLFN
jgi:hypothetical protein